MSRLSLHRPAKQRRALLESNPPRDNWIERRRNKTVSTFGEANTSPKSTMEAFISEPEHAFSKLINTCLEEQKLSRDGQNQQNQLRKNYVSSYPFFRSKRKVIDTCILNHCESRFHKVAWVVGQTAHDLEDRYPKLSYVFYTLRLKHLVDTERLDAAGDVFKMRFSEVRLANQKT